MKFLTDQENTAALLCEMPDKDRADYLAYGHNRLESAFIDRVFVVYECMGRDSKNVQRPPKIISNVRVVGFGVDTEHGSHARVLDEESQQTARVGHVPARLFDYPLFLSIPLRYSLTWDAQYLGEKLVRALTFAVFLKSRNKSTFFSKGNTYIETVNKLQTDLYPHIDLKLDVNK